MRPITAFIGVRISWLTVARKRDLLIEAWMASSWAVDRSPASSSLSRITTRWRATLRPSTDMAM